MSAKNRQMLLSTAVNPVALLFFKFVLQTKIHTGCADSYAASAAGLFDLPVCPSLQFYMKTRSKSSLEGDGALADFV